MGGNILKSAWQLGKEIGKEREVDANNIKVQIIRAGNKGVIQTYNYEKNGKSVKLYSEKEVRNTFKLEESLGNYQTEACSYELADGGWVPRLEVAENKGVSIEVVTWAWHSKRFPTKEIANKYATVAGAQKLQSIVED